jgi:uncharacterized ubiquitin-like protein YukD
MSKKNRKKRENRIPSARERPLHVTLRSERGHKEVDLEIPSDQPIGEWMSDLIKILNWPRVEMDQPLNYRLRMTSGRILSDRETLNDAGIKNYDVLWISLKESESESGKTDHGNQDDQVQEMGQTSDPHFEVKESDQLNACLSITEPSLVSASGNVFVLGTPPISIGRKSSKYQPDIDLTKLDEEHVSSRRHATISKEDDRWALLARETMNGTFLNGVRLSPGDKLALKDGDKLQFGIDGVELVFCGGQNPR